MTLTSDATEFNWLLDSFVTGTTGVAHAVAVSSDGLLMARSDGLAVSGAHQVAAIIAGLVSLGEGTTRCLDFEEIDQIIVAMAGGFFYVTAMGPSGCLGVVTTPGADMEHVGYQMGELAKRAADAPRELVVTVKQTIKDMADISEHPAAVKRELDPQLWSTRQPWFAERIAAIQAKISSKPS